MFQKFIANQLQKSSFVKSISKFISSLVAANLLDRFVFSLEKIKCTISVKDARITQVASKVS